MDEYGDALFRYALSRVGSQEAAEDVVQETLISALRGFEGFEGRSSTKTWLFSILRNRLIDHVRKASREREHIESEGDEVEVMYKAFSASGIWSVYVPNWAGDPDRALESREFLVTLQGCMEKLPERARLAFTLKFLKELDAEEICKALGLDERVRKGFSEIRVNFKVKSEAERAKRLARRVW